MLHRDYSIRTSAVTRRSGQGVRRARSLGDDAQLHPLARRLPHEDRDQRMLNEETDKKGSHLSFWAVHDAFGTHPCDVGRMRRLVI